MTFDILKEKITNLKLDTKSETLVALYACENVVLMVFKHKGSEDHGAQYVTRDGKLPGTDEQLVVYKPMIIT